MCNRSGISLGKQSLSRLSFLGSLLHPESLRLDWLCLAVSHDAPHTASTVDGQGNPRYGCNYPNLCCFHC